MLGGWCAAAPSGKEHAGRGRVGEKQMRKDGPMLAMAGCFLALCGVLATSDVIAQEEVAVAVGVVEVTADDSGNVKAVRLVTEGAVRRVTTRRAFYNIVLDHVGMRLGNEMEGELVRAIGTVGEAGEEPWMAVHWYEKVGRGDEQ